MNIARPLIPLPDDIKIVQTLFLSEIDVTPVRTTGYWLLFRKTTWRLNEPFGFKIYATSKGRNYCYEITIKKGFETDFASIPKVFWWLYSPEDCRYNKAAIAHDILYAGEVFIKSFNDDVLAMGMENASRLNRWNFHQAVKWFGNITYKGHREESIEAARQLIDMKVFLN
ncbi:MAG TPA: hypothetical protein DET40_10105 [Lentisphaeria bacterium]|nr:MAG: hypothetical protein A2X45_21785 [Lentisphaerae bacterium GWF2_50_93]HCE43888.1 hypothetical protein [Lentisphaeria bacterium]